MVLAGISLIFTLTNSDEQKKFSNFMLSLLWVLLWGAIMYKLCETGHEFWAWIILFLPFILWLVVLLLAILGLIAYNL
jgi:hypothetical protein